MPTYVSINQLWKLGKTGLQRPIIKKYCEEGVLPCVKDPKSGRFKIYAPGVEEALRKYAEQNARKLISTPESRQKRGRKREYEI